jgi:hypothetical protein
MGDRHEEKGPLQSEQLERDKWREGETLLDEDDAPGHTLPESERDRAKDDQERRTGSITPIIPPD